MSQNEPLPVLRKPIPAGDPWGRLLTSTEARDLRAFHHLVVPNEARVIAVAHGIGHLGYAYAPNKGRDSPGLRRLGGFLLSMKG